MKKIFFTIFCVILSLNVFSQIDDDVEIISSPSEESTFDYPKNNFATPNSKPVIVRQKRKNPLLSPLLTRGWRLFAEFAIEKGFDDYSCNVIDFSMSLGWQFNKCFYAGIGIGEEAYIDHWKLGYYASEARCVLVLPLFADVRYDFFNKKITPFVDFRIGYAASDDDYNTFSGLYLCPSIGARLWKFNLSVGTENLKLDNPRLLVDITNNQIQLVELYFQQTFFVKLSYEFGGNF